MRIIGSLYEYAQARGLGLSPFVSKKVLYRLTVSKDGFVGFDRVEVTAQVPIEGRSSEKAKPYALHDLPEYVLGLPPEGKDAKNTKLRFDTFWSEARRLADEAGDRSLVKAIDATLEDRSWLTKAKKLIQAKGEGWIGLALKGDEGLAIERPKVQEHFKERFNQALNAGGGPDFCIISGEPCTAVNLHDPISNIPGTGKPSALVTFNAATATYEGCEKGLNAPMSPKVMKGYTAALNEIAKTSLARIHDTMSLAFWGPPQADAFAKVIQQWTKGPDREKAWADVEAMRSSTETVYVAGFKGSQKRIAILNFDAYPAGEIATRLLLVKAAFAAFTKTAPTLMDLLQVTDEAKDKRRVNPMLKHATIMAILSGRSIPTGFLYQIFSSLTPREITENHWRARRSIAWLVMFGILKGVKPMDPSKAKTKPELDDFVVVDHESDAYQLGRLVACTVSLKRQGHSRTLSDDGSLSALNMASTSPAAFWSRFTRDLVIYEAKIRKNHRHHEFLVVTREILTKFRDTAFWTRRAPLSLADRANFSQGFLVQQAFNIALAQWKWSEWKAKKEAEKKEAETTDAAAE